MFSSPTIIIDCGASQATLGVFTREGDRLKLAHHAAAIFPPQSGPMDNWLPAISAALQTLRSGLRTGGPATLVLPAHLLLTKLIRVPLVDPVQRAKIIRFEAAQSIPSALSEVVWDSVRTGESDTHAEMLIVAVKLETVELLCAAAEAAGFVPRFVLPSPLATLAGFRLARKQRIESSLVLNLGTRSATLLRVEAKRFALRTFPLTDQVQAGEGGSPEMRVARLVQDVTRAIAQIQSATETALPEILHLGGAGAAVAGLGDALTAKLKVRLEPLNLAGAVNGAGTFDGDATEEQTLVDLAGAAATQLFPEQARLNLLPSRRRNREDLRRRQPWLIAAGLLAVVSLIPPAVYFHRVTTEARGQTAAIERELGPLRVRVVRNRERRRKIAQISEQVALLRDIHERRTAWLSLLADLENRLGQVDDVWLDQLQLGPGAAGGPVELMVSGRMLDRADPVTPAGTEIPDRVKELLAIVGDSPFVGTIRNERFDPSQPGILKFEFVVVAEAQPPL